MQCPWWDLFARRLSRWTPLPQDAAPSASGVSKSKSHMLYGSDGFMDPRMMTSNEAGGSAITDGYAVGIARIICPALCLPPPPRPPT